MQYYPTAAFTVVLMKQSGGGMMVKDTRQKREEERETYLPLIGNPLPRLATTGIGFSSHLMNIRRRV